MVQDGNDFPASAPLAPPPAAMPAAHAAADLAERRQAMRLTIGDVAQRLKLSPRQIEALEAGDWTGLPGMAFVRGALRSYGRLLGLDMVHLLEQVGVQAEPLRQSTSLRQPLPRRTVLAGGAGGGRPSSLGRIVLAVALLAALALYFGGTRDLSQVRSWIGVPADGSTRSADGGSAADGDGAAADVPTSDAATVEAGASSEPIAPADLFSAGTTPPPLVPAAPAANPSAGRRP